MEELQALKERSQVFLQKLRAKAQELEDEVLPVVQSVYDEDPDRYKREYGHFKQGIVNQFKSLIQKANEVYDKQISPKRNIGVNATSDYKTLFQEITKLFEDFRTEMYAKEDQIFGTVKEISNEVYLQKALAEYEEVKNAFTCTQCGAPIEIKELYFVSTYIRCEYCQTQNTFVPGSNMQHIRFYTRDIGEERHKDLEQQYEDLRLNSAKEKEALWAYFHYRAMVWLEKVRILPIMKEEDTKVFYREIGDDVNAYTENKFTYKPELYTYLLERLGFEEEYPIANITKDSPQYWEKQQLLALSLGFLEHIGDFDKYTDTYHQHHQRLQQTINQLNNL
ncbi:TFIIB-type zinc ribbon-containing protein [Ornithobacterium rhinotracheale]|uniref:hypothetical protein n=1 Tax=Ornithobacterium rhinotracheale TaxID=28251 RepID=UPI001FF5D53E|nr:hypothetical protein [Ornithobacterium rhinotracheale]MCK0205092.1 hypothetical protein [Ornithobacterium rhinotracheale]